MLIDTHLHLFDEDYDVGEVISRAKDSGVNYLIVSGSVLEDNILNDKFSSHYDNVFISVGFHPEYCNDVDEKDFLFIETVIKNNKKVVAIGEIGLDYHYEKSLTINEKQQKVFKKMLSLATDNNKKVIIHTREASYDTLNILKKYKINGVIHSFNGDLNLANEYINLGYLLGINGVVTFKNSSLIDIVKEISLENILLETDSPYLTPHPYRGMKNTPKNISIIAEFITHELDLSLDVLASILDKNFTSFFDI